MRHGKKINHLGRTASHRQATLSNMASSLVLSDKKRIITTVAKAKALRKYVEPLITKAKSNTTHSRRVVFSYLQNKYAVTELFDVIAAKVGDRPGGYTRILKIGNRQGDNAEMALIEIVDFNEFYTSDSGSKKTTRRRRAKAAPAEGKKKETPKAKEEVAPVVEEVVAVQEEVVAEVEETVDAVDEATDEASEEEK